jgi:hypothetical protein
MTCHASKPSAGSPGAGEKRVDSSYLNEEGLPPWQVLLRQLWYIVEAYWDKLLIMLASALGLLSFIALVLLYRKEPDNVLLFLAFPLYLIALFTPTNAPARYMIPMIPFQLIAIATVLAFFLDWIRRTNSRRAP